LDDLLFATRRLPFAKGSFGSDSGQFVIIDDTADGIRALRRVGREY
jgi:hypothetical protein